MAKHPHNPYYSGPKDASKVAQEKLSWSDRIVDAHATVLGHPLFLYFCWLLDILELYPVWQAHSLILWVGYLSQTVIQLVALPSLQAKANRESRHSEEQSKQQYENQLVMEHTLDSVHNDIKKILKVVESK